MLDTLYIEDVAQADALLKPKRVQIMRELAEPRTCTEIGGVMGETPQAIYYHVKRLQAAGLVYLLNLTEELARDLANLAVGPITLPSFGIAGDVSLSPEDGAAFVGEL